MKIIDQIASHVATSTDTAQYKPASLKRIPDSDINLGQTAEVL